MLECVVNVSEGRSHEVVDAIAHAGGRSLLDAHTDPDHHRSVLTLAGPDVEAATRGVAAEAVRRIDISRHDGAHPRMGAVDVVPFVPLAGSGMGDALVARDRFGEWAGRALGLPCFRYGPERPLPEVRRRAFATLAPDDGPSQPHPSAGAAAIGARPVLVAYNLWLADVGADEARRVAAALRSPTTRALGLDLDGHAQVSLNLVAPFSYGPDAAFDAVASRLAVARAELVGLIPAAVLDTIAPHRWPELGLSRSRTIEARLEAAGLPPT